MTFYNDEYDNNIYSYFSPSEKVRTCWFTSVRSVCPLILYMPFISYKFILPFRSLSAPEITNMYTLCCSMIIHVYTRRGKSACTSGDAFSEVAILHNNQGHWSALTGTCSCIVLRRQKAIAAHFESEQILPIVFVRLYLIGHKT